MSETVIKIENLTKDYRLGVISHRTLYRDIQSLASRVFNKEDPNSLIGSNDKRLHKDIFHALDNISLEIEKGDVVGVIGKNGAGKSTLLKILSRVTSPTKGEIKIKGRIASLLEVGTGFHPELTGRQNVFLNGAILGMRKKEIQAKFDEIVDFSGVGEFIDTPVKRYSSGMHVRLAFAVAAHLDPEILIVDEVLAVGDAEFQKKCLGKMKDVSSTGRTILFVSHNMSAMTNLCNKGVYLKQGKIAGTGGILPIINSYMGDGSLALTQKAWDEKDAPGDGSARLLEIRLVNEKNEPVTYVLLGDKKFGIEFKYKVLEPISMPVPQLHFFNDRQDNVCISYGNFEYSNFYSSDEILSPGIYNSTAWLPQKMFNTQFYQVSVGMSNLEKSVLHFWEQEAITFEVVEDLSLRKILYKGSIGGLLRPELEWQNTKLV